MTWIPVSIASGIAWGTIAAALMARESGMAVQLFLLSPVIGLAVGSVARLSPPTSGWQQLGRSIAGLYLGAVMAAVGVALLDHFFPTAASAVDATGAAVHVPLERTITLYVVGVLYAVSLPPQILILVPFAYLNHVLIWESSGLKQPRGGGGLTMQ